MARAPEAVFPDIAREHRNLVEWVTKLERRIDALLENRDHDPMVANDHMTAVVRAFSPAELSGSTASVLERSVVELQTRYRAAGWDEATVDVATGVMSLKRFRRHVLVTVLESNNELRAPVFETETHEQAARRIVTDGFKYGVGGSEPGLLVINPNAIRYVRIPVRSY